MKESFILIFLGFTLLLTAEPVKLPKNLRSMLQNTCIDCHDEDLSKADINLDFDTVDWSKPARRKLLEKVLDATKNGVMPPVNKTQPTLKQRSELIAYLDKMLVKNTPFEKTKVRRLSNREYEKTIQKLFNYPDFKLKAGFPADHIQHGFDNQASGLEVSSALMHSYVETANSLTDWYFQKSSKKYKPLNYSGGPQQMTQTFSSSEIRDDGKSLRLASKHDGSVFRACSWSSDLEIKRSGVYDIEISSSKFKPNSEKPMQLEVRARGRLSSDRSKVTTFRLLKTIDITKTSPQTFKFSSILHDGETLMFRWVNSKFDHTPDALIQAATEKFKKDPRYHAAWLEVIYPQKGKGPYLQSLRGMNGHRKVQETYKKKDLFLKDAKLDSARTTKLFDMFKSGARAQQGFCDTWAHLIFEEGPCLQVHTLKVNGPTKIVDSLTEIAQQKRKEALLGKRNKDESDSAYLKRFLEGFLTKAFRSEVDEPTIKYYEAKAKAQWDKGVDFDESMHIVLRHILLSPRFIFRDMNQNLSVYNLASRLSYFLTSSPPDAPLVHAAKTKNILNDSELETQAKRLLPVKIDHPFVNNFPKQWLNTRSLDFVMPDANLKFSDKDLEIAKMELYYFFNEILKKNRPLTDFIDPNFIYTNPAFAKKHYGLKNVPNKKGYVKIPIKRGHRHGGLLGMAATMIATANGVDTQPVVRGVWFLEHIIGMSPPEPPKDVPALTPDTQGATSPRDLLTKHTSEPKCAGCHRLIDPFGFVFENYNAVGKWRDKWPKAKKKINTSTKLFDGTKISGPQDLRKWMLNNIDLFGQCLAEKLMTYALGREPNYREKAEIKVVVQNNIQKKEGFRDLILALVKTHTFKAQK